MSNSLEAFKAPEPEKPIVEIDDPVNLRPDLSELGLVEVERGVCEDTFENRSVLRRAKLGWDTVYSTNGVPTGLIQARSASMATERRLLSLAEKRPILVAPDEVNSDYLTGVELLIEPAADSLVPPWVLGATKMWRKEQTDPIASEKRNPTALPHRCRQVKDDGIRCMLWSSGRIKDDGLCRVHLRSIKHKPSDDVERARKKLTQAAPYAVDVLEDLMTYAASEPVKLKAASEILDRAGVRGGVELDANINVHDDRSAADVILARLNQLSTNASQAVNSLVNDGVDIVDGEVVDDEPSSASGGALPASD